MPFSTPTRGSYEKRVHTPPTIERESGSRTASKFLKGLSNSVFKKPANEISSQNVKISTSGSFRSNKTLRMSKRTNTPEPLNLSGILSPPPSTKRGELSRKTTSTSHSSQSSKATLLASPITLFPSSKDKKGPTKLKNALQSPVIIKKDTSRFESKRRGYLEEASPLHMKNLSQNIRKLRSNSSNYKKHVGETCSICDEQICNSFSGEKTLELTCSHVAHFNCYLIVFEEAYHHAKIPNCRSCNKSSEPVDDDSTELLMSNVLSNNQNYGKTSSEQYLEQIIHKGSEFLATSFTPIDQTIKTADITCDGFNALTKSDSETITDLRTGGSFSPIFTYTSIASDIDDSDEDEDTNAPQVEYSLDTTDHEPQISLKFPGAQVVHNLLSRLQQANDGNQEEELRRLIMGEVREKFDVTATAAQLLMFDFVNYSTNGEEWEKNVLLYYFQDVLIIYDDDNCKIIGKIPINQISNAVTINEEKLLLDLKSTIVPEIYLQFTRTLSSNSKFLTEKWKYYLTYTQEIPSMMQMTDTALSVLSSKMCDMFLDWTRDKSPANEEIRWWDKRIFLRLIVCVSVSSFGSGDSKENYKDTLVAQLKEVVSSLNKDDLFGLVLTGKKGDGTFGRNGTFVGMVNKQWDGWNDFIDGLNTTGDSIFGSEEEEMSVALETCYKLASSVNIGDTQTETYLNQIIVLKGTEDTDQTIERTNINMPGKILDVLFDRHEFELEKIGLWKGSASISHKIDNLRQKTVKELIVRINDIDIKMGSMNPRLVKKCKVKEYRNLLSNEFGECTVKWLDVKTKLRHEERVKLSFNKT
ncbi:cyclin-dependent protein serine/threonine kinase inhibiting protein FAR1 KNAG_0C02490 [Huiozyma naganishii CBS 8797]|uniref:Uncharacterized protein n=1 Tax=Huiozyma naganishii (strain ATCC MYA-139 / BCRC 22969 / CBS 8797 / KCTC 17520 / NBRC 10181 / NCYC 3082 / Yp74L-3) TaxID=1071383 RepID=J7R3F3_HUIN7|nr:hypothetical protein KNAG_0C02490 [Kazachstania naganishii CBS 8797]CCK69360.1 hypothetical protein KNAG_0C02490 [Kazachstania naganishii CBS 8797]